MLLEEFLAGEEGTVTVLPPVKGEGERMGYRALPFVRRVGHEDDVAPYSGRIAVTANSRALNMEETAMDESYEEVMRQCVRVAELVRPTAPMRIDVRRVGKGTDSPFALFDVNMKPVRENCQAMF